ncbi:GDP-mannose 4,6-dehydratase [Pedobacter xixiisoli]|uniref:GDP-mannose 4,6-dehydratase n=1 Tax=Pedobacter xixiisoli TaxID=1476464 RepID=A0A286ADA6_9SPHI|nr:GDP-mannose 4,6-dehydratase [Pedobacter xixiisoli]SOD19855.1 GDPmannose 4,6-dehydratase [Pedobacter xixiisoli]
MKTAIISGISGQDGAYLAALLLKKNYRVIGLIREGQSKELGGLTYLGVKGDIILKECNLMNKKAIVDVISSEKPEEIYNLAAQSSVFESFNNPIDTFKFNTISVFNFLETIKLVNPAIRLYQASSSEMCGKVNELPITENSVLHPLSPYATSKVAAHFTCVNYRESYKLYVACGILFNHESYLRSENFFVKKVLQQSIRIAHGLQDFIEVGNVDIKRDFGYSPSYVEAMYQMLQQERASDYLICSGKSISLKSIIHYVFDMLNISKDRCIVNPMLYRPNEILDIYGDNTKAKNELGWNYDYDFYKVLELLLEEELKNLPKI